MFVRVKNENDLKRSAQQKQQKEEQHYHLVISYSRICDDECNMWYELCTVTAQFIGRKV